jgi:hypothetical protein
MAKYRNTVLVRMPPEFSKYRDEIRVRRFEKGIDKELVRPGRMNEALFNALKLPEIRKILEEANIK